MRFANHVIHENHEATRIVRVLGSIAIHRRLSRESNHNTSASKMNGGAKTPHAAKSTAITSTMSEYPQLPAASTVAARTVTLGGAAVWGADGAAAGVAGDPWGTADDSNMAQSSGSSLLRIRGVRRLVAT
jgi:hypothetical protein